MARIVALDIGKKRTGVAATDPLRLIANGIGTVDTSALIGFLESYMAAEEVALLVVGYPLQTNGRPSEALRYINPVLRRIAARFPELPIEQFDERYTSTLAHRAMIDGGMRRMARRDKAMVDTISATIILQSFMDSRRYGELFP
ncbi:MAG: Holliday junction resolvase RuvX [Bacteroidales bacterium]|nr:Holliday junction resolvase RuvX [Bacteroidales bacterium]